MPSLKRLQRQFQGIQNVRQPVRKKFHALIGHPDGSTIDDPENAAFVFVRIDGDSNRTERALCREVLRLYNQKVIVAYSDELPNTLEIIKLDKDAFPPAAGGGSSYDGSAQLGNHAPQHAMYGGDTVWIQTKQILPQRTRPAVPASMRVYVESGPYQYQAGFNYWPGGYSSDMTAHIPATANMQLYRVVYINAATNVLAYTNTAESIIDPYLADFESVLDLIPVSCVPLAAVRLYNGQTTIAEAQIFDLRSFVSSAPGSVTGISWGKVRTVATSAADYTSIFTALSAAASGDIILVMPGTYTTPLTVGATVTVQGLDQGMERATISSSVANPLSLSTGSPRIHNLVIQAGGGYAALNIMAGGTSVVSNCYIAAETPVVQNDNSGSLSLKYCEIVASGATAIQQGINDTLSLIGCTITGHVTQTGTGSTLTIDGGKITGNLTCASGSTVALHNLPTITGTVTISGTLTGVYRDGSGNIVVPGTQTVDGVDISAHAADANAHHAAVTLAADADTVLGLSTQQLTLDTQAANTIFAGPTSGGAADPTFRAMVAADIAAHASTHAPSAGDAVFPANAAGVLANDGAGVLSWAAGSTSPGGADTQVQYNNGGAFGGSAFFVFDDTTGTITLRTSGEQINFSGVADGVNNFGLIFDGGNGAGAGIDGGAVVLGGGDGNGAAAGGNVSLVAGNGGATSGVGGTVRMTAGRGVGGDSDGGDVILTVGAESGAGVAGIIYLNGAIEADSTLSLAATSNQIVLQSAGVTGTLTWTPTTSGKVITLPDATGTAVLGTGTATRVAFWSDANTLTSDADMTFVTDTLTVAKINASTSLAVAGGTAYTSISNNPGAAAAILASTAAGLLTLVDLDATAFIDALTDGSGGGLRAGTGTDVLWYRGAADTWQTPDAVTVGGVLKTADTTDSSSITTGALQSAGGLGVTKAAYIGGALNVAAAGTFIVTDAVTAAASDVLIYSHNSTGTPASGFGANMRLNLETDTTPGQPAGLIQSFWGVATHASRKAVLRFMTYDTAAREGLRIYTDGSNPLIGFLGAAAVARPAAYTQTYSTATRTHSNPTATDPGTYAAGANGYSTGALAQALFNSVEALVVDVANVKQVLNQVIDDLQSYGLLQ